MTKSEHGFKPIRTESTGTKPNPAKELAELKKGIAHVIRKCELLKVNSPLNLSTSNAFNAGKNLAYDKVISDLKQLTNPTAMGKSDDML